MGHAFKLRGGGGGSGASLIFSAPAGAIITVSKDGKNKTKTADSSGAAKFTGLSTGVWSWSMRDSTHEATSPANVEITADYYITAAFFAATIAVTYPEGSTCTCSDGTTTLTAVGTTGSYTFTVPNAGEWTVSCTDGTDTASMTVSITYEGQVESVSLSYVLWLYNKGDECISVTGGWQARAWKEGNNPNYTDVAPTLTKNADYMQIVFPASNKSGVVEVVKDIALAGYKTLKIVLKSVNNYTSDMVSPRLIIVPRSATYWFGAIVGSVKFPAGGSGEYSIDLTALSLPESAYDIAIGGETYTSKFELEVESVWAE